MGKWMGEQWYHLCPTPQSFSGDSVPHLIPDGFSVAVLPPTQAHRCFPVTCQKSSSLVLHCDLFLFLVVASSLCSKFPQPLEQNSFFCLCPSTSFAPATYSEYMLDSDPGTSNGCPSSRCHLPQWTGPAMFMIKGSIPPTHPRF